MKPALQLAILFALAAAAHAPSAAAAVARAEADSSFRMPFRLVDNRVFIDVELNGQGPFHFILDTGADRVLAASTARRLGLATADAGETEGWGRRRRGRARRAWRACGSASWRWPTSTST